MLRYTLLRTLTAVGLMASLLAAAMAADGRADGEKVRLRLRLEKGKSYRIKMTVNQDIAQTIQGNKIDVKQTMGMEYAFDVEDVKPDGAMVAKVSYHAVQMKTDGPTGKVDYDSNNPPETIPAAAKGLAALVGQGFTIEITPEGRVTRVEGIDALMTRMIEKLELPPGPMKAVMEDQLKKQFGDKPMRETMEQLMAIYPEKPVGVGDAWTRSVKVTKGFPMQMENRYILKDRKDGVATLAVRSTIKSDPKAEPIKMGAVTISYELTGKQEGTTNLDEATGWTLSGKVTQEFSGKMRMEGAPGATEPISWPITAKSIIEVEGPVGK